MGHAEADSSASGDPSASDPASSHHRPRPLPSRLPIVNVAPAKPSPAGALRDLDGLRLRSIDGWRLGNPDLQDAVGEGGLNALGRHTVAALLNGASADVDADLTAAQVIAAFNAVFPGGDYEGQKNIFAGFNEQGCPLARNEG